MRAFIVLRAVVLLGILFSAVGTATGEVIGGSFGGTQRTDGGIVAGNTFTALGGQTFNSLGFIDIGNDGLLQSYTVGIWDTATQNLLQSAVVTPTSPLINGYRYAPIPATFLPNNTQFTIGALLPAGTVDPWLDDTTNVLGVGFTGSGQGQFISSLTLVYPTTFDDGNYAIANASATIVPEPATLGTLGAAAASLLLVRRRRCTLG